MRSLEHSINVALIGYGFAGKTFHAPLIQSVSGLKLTVVSSSRPDEVRKRLPSVEIVAKPEEAVTRTDVDLVVVASPNEFHASTAKIALNAGKHVVVDKPFTLTLEEARRLAELASEKKRLLSVFQNRRWDSDFLAVKALIAEDRLGEILHFESHFDRYRPEVGDQWRERVCPGSGLWYGAGPHLVDQALQLFGLPNQIKGDFAIQRVGARVDDWAHVLLDYGRLRVVLHTAMLVAGGVPRMAIHGTRGSWIKCGSDVQESQLIIGMHPNDVGWGADPVSGHYHDGSGSSPLKLPVPRGDHSQYYKAIRDALLNGMRNPVAPPQAIATIAVLETAIKSAEAGRALCLPLTEQERVAYKESVTGCWSAKSER